MPKSAEHIAIGLIDRGVRMLAEKTHTQAVCVVLPDRGYMICAANLAKEHVAAVLRDAATQQEKETPEEFKNLVTGRDYLKATN